MTTTQEFQQHLPSQIRREPIFEGLVGKDIKKGQAHEPYVEVEALEQLEAPLPHVDNRLHMRKERIPLLTPRYNSLYDSLRSKQAWRYTADNLATGTITTIAGSVVLVAVTLAQVMNVRTSQWPGAVQMYLVLRSFSIAPQTATFATVGAIDCIYQDASGFSVPLGDFLNNSAVNSSPIVLIPVPITDPGNNKIGQLQVTLNAGATIGTYFWQLGFSYAYLAAQEHGYDIVQQQPFIEVEDHDQTIHHAR